MSFDNRSHTLDTNNNELGEFTCKITGDTADYLRANPEVGSAVMRCINSLGDTVRAVLDHPSEEEALKLLQQLGDDLASQASVASTALSNNL